jgi:putative ABC transport system permease protein
MIVVKLAFRNLVRNGKKNLTIGMLIALGIAMMFVGNAIFDGTDSGIRRTFIDSFTADVSISASSEESFSIFGNETPVIGELSTVPTIVPYDEVLKAAVAKRGVAKTASVVSGLIGIELRDKREAVPVFGVDGDGYFACFPGIDILRGSRISGSQPGIMLTEKRATDIEKLTGKPLVIGEPVQADVLTAKGFQIREVPLTGIFRYPVGNETLDRIVILDVTTLRSLYGLTLGVDTSAIATKSQTGLLDKSVNDLFDTGDATTQAASGITITDVEKNLKETEKRNELLKVDTGAWDFILLRLEPGVNSALFVQGLNKELSSKGWAVKVADWRHTAGNSALFIYWLGIIFNIGFLIIAIAGTIIIINTLVIAVLERTGEIGTMRAIGASTGFVRRLLLAEMMSLSVAAGIAGILVGILAVLALSKTGLALHNPILVSLFVTTVLRPQVTFTGILRHLGVAFLIGAVSSMYPVRLALRIQPVRAIATE